MDIKQPSLITTTILLILGLGIFYFLDLPQYDKDKAQKEKIVNFTEQKRIKEEHTKKIAQIGLSIKDIDWEAKKKKIEPNFTSTPFFIPKMQVYFKDLVSRSGMSLVSVEFNLGGAAQAATDAKIKPVADESLDTPKNQSGVIGIKGPVKRNGFNLGVTGTYEDLKKLLAIFENQAYLISVKNVSFEDGKSNQFNFKISGNIYSY